MNQDQGGLLGQLQLGKLRWEILATKSLPRLPRSRITTYPIQFIIWNDYDHLLRVKVQLKSPSKVLVFREITHQMKGKSRIRWTKDSLTKSIEHKIPHHQSKVFNFSTFYRPHFAQRLQPILVLHYRIYGLETVTKTVLRSDPYRIEIPIEKMK